MKKQAIIISSIVIFLTMIVNIGDLRCQEKSNMIDAQHQSKYMERMPKGVDEDNLKDDKNIRVKILEWIIMNSLHNAYQGIDSKELEDMVERSR